MQGKRAVAAEPAKLDSGASESIDDHRKTSHPKNTPIYSPKYRKYPIFIPALPAIIKRRYSIIAIKYRAKKIRPQSAVAVNRMGATFSSRTYPRGTHPSWENLILLCLLSVIPRCRTGPKVSCPLLSSIQRKSYDRGADAYLLKSSDLTELKQKIRAILGARKRGMKC
jgi:hypothetical protein